MVEANGAVEKAILRVQMQVGEVGHMRRSSLALRARASQRKRIHSLSTSPRRARKEWRTWQTCSAWLLGALAAVASGGCGGGGDASGTGPFALMVVTATLHVGPGDQTSASFILVRGGAPAAGQTVTFTIEPPTTDAAGATLTPASAITDATGTATVGVEAGQPASFYVQAQSQGATAEVLVVVETSGTVLVAPFFAPSSTAAADTASIRVLLYDDSSCGALDLDAPAASSRDAITLQGNGAQTAEFPFVSTTVVNAAIGQALAADGVTVVADGCVDIPGSSLLAAETVEVALPLYDAVPDPVGTYTVTSTLTFTPPLAAAPALGAAWTNLSDCPLDPAELWLDCTVDALSPATAADPLDCVPATAPGSEGALGDAITALRGAPLLDDTGGPTGCRSARDAAGDESLDALSLGLFGSPVPAAIVALPGIASDATAILDSVRLISMLVVAPSGTAGSYAVTHTLVNALFGPGWQTSVPLASLGLPSLQAFTTATTSDDILTIGDHGFTLRLGTTARAAFGPLSLAPRGLPSDIPSFVSALFALASSADGTATGCAALDGVICPAVGQPVGCATSACATGLAALAGQLEGAFSGADGTGLDSGALRLGAPHRQVQSRGGRSPRRGRLVTRCPGHLVGPAAHRPRQRTARRPVRGRQELVTVQTAARAAICHWQRECLVAPLERAASEATSSRRPCRVPPVCTGIGRSQHGLSDTTICVSSDVVRTRSFNNLSTASASPSHWLSHT